MGKYRRKLTEVCGSVNSVQCFSSISFWKQQQQHLWNNIGFQHQKLFSLLLKYLLCHIKFFKKNQECLNVDVASHVIVDKMLITVSLFINQRYFTKTPLRVISALLSMNMVQMLAWQNHDFTYSYIFKCIPKISSHCIDGNFVLC